MELAKLSSKGQVTIPSEIRKRLNLKKGDKLFFLVEADRVYLQNASLLALNKLQVAMESEAKKADFKSEEDVVRYIKDLRKAGEA